MTITEITSKYYTILSDLELDDFEFSELDSLDILDLEIAIESELGMRVIEDQFVELKSHEDVINYIWDLLNQEEIFDILEHDRTNHNNTDVRFDIN